MGGKAAVEAAQKGITDGSIKVDTAFDANFDLAALRDSVSPYVHFRSSFLLTF